MEKCHFFIFFSIFYEFQALRISQKLIKINVFLVSSIECSFTPFTNISYYIYGHYSIDMNPQLKKKCNLIKISVLETLTGDFKLCNLLRFYHFADISTFLDILMYINGQHKSADPKPPTTPRQRPNPTHPFVQDAKLKRSVSQIPGRGAYRICCYRIP